MKTKLITHVLGTIFALTLLKVVGLLDGSLGNIIQTISFITGLIFIGKKIPIGWFIVSLYFLIGVIDSQTSAGFMVNLLLSAIPITFYIKWNRDK